jgi:hypothetical protein
MSAQRSEPYYPSSPSDLDFCYKNIDLQVKELSDWHRKERIHTHQIIKDLKAQVSIAESRNLDYADKLAKVEKELENQKWLYEESNKGFMANLSKSWENNSELQDKHNSLVNFLQNGGPSRLLSLDLVLQKKYGELTQSQQFLLDVLLANPLDHKWNSELFLSRIMLERKDEAVSPTTEIQPKSECLVTTPKKKRSKGEECVAQLLDQMQLKYVEEFSPPWANRLRYDLCLSDHQILIEFDGIQHFEFKPSWLFSKTHQELLKTQATDVLKMRLAFDHGYKVIRLSHPFLKEHIVHQENTLERGYQVLKTRKCQLYLDDLLLYAPLMRALEMDYCFGCDGVVPRNDLIIDDYNSFLRQVCTECFEIETLQQISSLFLD